MSSILLASCCFSLGFAVLGQPAPPPSAEFPGAKPEPVEAPTSPEAAPSPTPTAGNAVAPSPAELWHRDYTRARQQLVKGEFAAAAAAFATLAERAPGPSERARARELADIATTLGTRESRAHAPRTATPAMEASDGRRSSDEIASLYANAVLYGIGSGAFLAVHTEPETAAGGILPALALGGALGGVVAAVDRGDTLRYGVPQTVVTGLYIGLEEGIAWAIWNQARSSYFEQWSEKTVATVIWGSATAGAIAGAVLGANYATTPGRASYVGSTALWGGAITGFFAAAAGADDEYLDDRAFLGAALGLNVGALAGVLSAPRVSPSIARVRILDLGAIAGGILAGGLYVSAVDEVDDARGLLAVSALGMGAGIGTAALFTAKLPSDSAVTRNSVLPVPTRFALMPLRQGAALGFFGTL